MPSREFGRNPPPLVRSGRADIAAFVSVDQREPDIFGTTICPSAIVAEGRAVIGIPIAGDALPYLGPIFRVFSRQGSDRARHDRRHGGQDVLQNLDDILPDQVRHEGRSPGAQIPQQIAQWGLTFKAVVAAGLRWEAGGGLRSAVRAVRRQTSPLGLELVGGLPFLRRMCGASTSSAQTDGKLQERIGVYVNRDPYPARPFEGAEPIPDDVLHVQCAPRMDQ